MGFYGNPYKLHHHRRRNRHVPPPPTFHKINCYTNSPCLFWAKLTQLTVLECPLWHFMMCRIFRGDSQENATSRMSLIIGFQPSLDYITKTYLLTAVDCDTLANPTNGQVCHTGGTMFGQTATYSCNTGYNLVGNSTCTRQTTCTTSYLGWQAMNMWLCHYLMEECSCIVCVCVCSG